MTRTQHAPTALLVLGNEEFLRARATLQFHADLTAQEGELSHRTATADGLNTHEVDELLTPDLMGGYPVLTITEGNKLAPATLTHLTTYISAPDCGLIVDIPKPTEAGGKAVVTALQKAGIRTETVTPPKNSNDKRKFAAAELRRHGLRPTPEAEQALADGENDLRGIASRATQLATDHRDGNQQPTITEEHIAVVATSSTITGFVVSDALLTRNPQAIATATRNALNAGAAPLLIQASCLIALRDIAAIQTGNTHKMPPWKAQKLRGAAQRWNAPQLARALHEMGVIGETVRSSAKSENDLLAALLRAAA